MLEIANKLKTNMKTEEALRLGLITEEQLKNAPIMSVEEFDAMIERDKAYIPMIEKRIQRLIDLYDDICY